MTYGDTTSDLRNVMTELLRRHRILQPLGGPGMHTVPESTTVEERRVMGEQIQRFRHATLLWCHQATEAAAPKFIARLDDRGPAGNLRYRLGKTIGLITVPLPSIDELAKSHPNVLVETWREAACVSALGEHDFPAGIHHTRLDAAESRAVLKDAADFVRGLVILDQRYKNVPGWERLASPGRLRCAAEACSQFGAEGHADYSIDTRGWRPEPAAILSQPLPGIRGVLQAQHNMLVDLSRFPNALNLRRVIHSQVRVAHEAARHADLSAPELLERFRDRESTYLLLLRSSRKLGGLIGTGGLAGAESQNAAGRLQGLRAEVENAPSLHELARLFARTDVRVASIIERGFAENLYFVSVQYPRLGGQQHAGVVQQRERWVPVTSPVQSDLLTVARGRLCALQPEASAGHDALESRRAFEGALHSGSGQRARRGPTR